MFKIILPSVITIFCFITTNVTAGINPMAEDYISKMLNKEVPYQLTILNYPFVINNINVYPPGKLTEMFAEFLIENNLVKDKIVADIGAGCFALGIIASKNGAKQVIGTDISDDSIQCAQDNLALNNIKGNVHLLKGDGLSPLLPQFAGKIDIVLSGVPWDTISSSDFNKISPERKSISRSFYDVEDKLITDIMSKGFTLLAPQGRMFITSSLGTLVRIKQLCAKHNLSYKIVKEKDIHKDGNLHYVIEIMPKG